jgi:galactokinase/mevalonate kinase-like predicted kinase
MQERIRDSTYPLDKSGLFSAPFHPMKKDPVPLQYLLTLPPKMAGEFEALEHRCRPSWYATSDPVQSKLGSGGGTAHLLYKAWQDTGHGSAFTHWLRESRKLIVHGGGQSRRLPAYAPVGKLLMPIPVFRWARGQSVHQTLLDLQVPEYQRVLSHAPETTVAMVTSGDVILRFGPSLPPFPQVDVLGLGMWVTPETARHFGVFFCPRQSPNELAFFLQKPAPARLRELSMEYLCLVDTGMWLLSERAVAVLLARCGWDPETQSFRSGIAAGYELYGEFGLALGSTPTVQDELVQQLTTAVLPLPSASFYHFGASRQMIESISALQNVELDETKLGRFGARRHPDQYVQNSRFEYPLRQEENHTLWVENSTVPRSWRLACDHVLTGVPDNHWDLALEPGVCLDFVPVGERMFCVRAYGIHDAFRGALGDAHTHWFDRLASDWFLSRGLRPETAGLDPKEDIQKAALFPLVEPDQIDPRFLEWLFAAHPPQNDRFVRRWTECQRLSAEQISEQAALDRLYQQRAQNRQLCLLPLLNNSRWSVFFHLNLESTAAMYGASPHPLPGPEDVPGIEPMQQVRREMFRAAVMRHRNQEGWEKCEDRAFVHLRNMIEREAQLSAVTPRCCVLEDQIIWGRSPVRLDLAGGWTDTPPFCLEHGGRVVNLAVDLNGQPPIQVFAKLNDRPELVLRSIDLGIEQRVRTYEELETFADPGHEFALAKAAFALAGFLPRFHGQGGYRSLAEQLQDFGGGIEVSLLAAVPKGSGLGTSSILAATLLATLGELCGLNWDVNVLFSRTLALEQMLTTGGGWQDQAGGIYRGVKLIETVAGLVQRPTLRWLPEHLFESQYANKTILLYYTGLTRLAKNILHEVVRGVFLNDPRHLEILEQIGANAEAAFNALQQDDYLGLAAAVRRSWQLNQHLDSGTNPPPVQRILDSIGDYLAATKLLGAGGGGYLVMMAKDLEAAMRIRQTLAENPPNGRARFVNFSLSQTGLQLTRS